MIVHRKVNSVSNHTSSHEQTKLENNTWFEVSRDGIVWICDLFSLMKFNKDLYYKLEEPLVELEITRQHLQSRLEYHEYALNFKKN